MSDERAGDKPLPLGHLYKGYIAARHLDHCVHQAADQPQDCGQPRSAHEPPAEPKPAHICLDAAWDFNPEDCPACPSAAPAQPNAPAPEPETFEQRLAHLATLGEGWNSYGAAAISEKAIQAVREINLTPTSSGGIDVNFQGETASIEFDAEGQIVTVRWWKPRK